jgi:glycosyltransferase involved in cell wall biosynthesis
MNDITLVIPAKNEPNALPIVLEELQNKKIEVDILIIIEKNDIKTLEATKKYKCEILFQTNRGYGNAIIEGIKHVKTKYSCIFYADGSTDPIYIEKMFQKLKILNLDLVFGSRYEKGGHSHDDNLITKVGNFGFTFLGNFFMKLKITDLLFTYIFAKTEVFKKMCLNQNNYNLCVEIPFKAKNMGLNYSTIPCIERKRFADKKKVKAFSDGLKILSYLILRCLNIINR